MELRLVEINAPILDRDLIARGLAQIAARVPFPDDVTVIFTGEYEATVNELRPDPSDIYASERGSIQALAITLHDGGTNCTVVVNGLFWFRQEEIDRAVDQLRGRGGTDVQPPTLPIAEVLDPVRLLAHEAGHVALNQRGEGRASLGLPSDYLASIASVAVEEFRVERPLCEEGWFAPTGYMQSVAEDLAALDAALREIRMGPRDEAANRRVLALIRQEVPNVFLQLGYAAAEYTGARGQRAEVPRSQGWRKVIGRSWNEIVRAFQDFPGAPDNLGQDRYRKLLQRLAQVLKDSLDQYGLTIEQTAGQNIRYELRTDI